jgi:hypothetical protein
MFHDLHPKTTTTRLGDDSDDEDSIEMMKAVGYVQQLSSSHPISSEDGPLRPRPEYDERGADRNGIVQDQIIGSGEERGG